MSEKEVCKNLINLEPIRQSLHGRHAHPVVTHEYLLYICVLLKRLRHRPNLLIREHILDQIEISEGQQLEQISQSLPTNLIVVNVDIAEFFLIFKHLNKLFGTIVIDFVV